MQHTKRARQFSQLQSIPITQLPEEMPTRPATSHPIHPPIHPRHERITSCSSFCLSTPPALSRPSLARPARPIDVSLRCRCATKRSSSRGLRFAAAAPPSLPCFPRKPCVSIPSHVRNVGSRLETSRHLAADFLDIIGERTRSKDGLPSC